MLHQNSGAKWWETLKRSAKVEQGNRATPRLVFGFGSVSLSASSYLFLRKMVGSGRAISVGQYDTGVRGCLLHQHLELVNRAVAKAMA